MPDFNVEGSLFALSLQYSHWLLPPRSEFHRFLELPGSCQRLSELSMSTAATSLSRWTVSMCFPPPAPLTRRHSGGGDATWTWGSDRYNCAFWFDNLLANAEFDWTLIFLICKIGTKFTPTLSSPITCKVFPLLFFFIQYFLSQSSCAKHG